VTIGLRLMTPEEVAAMDAAEPMPPDEDWKTECDGRPHDWRPINTPRGRAHQCERCWDRTD
jgi:hypothetical protein